MSYSIISTLDLAQREDRTLICDAITERWRTDEAIETRVSILQSLTRSDLLKQNTNVFLPLVAEGLDDYTTTARGDVGSHVRLQAIRATKALWESITFDGGEETESVRLVQGLFLRILRLAAEKLDRVRVEAQGALAVVLKAGYVFSLLFSPLPLLGCLSLPNPHFYSSPLYSLLLPSPECPSLQIPHLPFSLNVSHMALLPISPFCSSDTMN